MPEHDDLTIEEIKERVVKANDDYHEAIDGIMLSEILEPKHKLDAAKWALVIFEAMGKVNEVMKTFVPKQ